MRVEQQILIIDVETTGFDPIRHACIELGAVLLDECSQLRRVFIARSALAWSGTRPESYGDKRHLDRTIGNGPTVTEVTNAFIERFCSKEHCLS